MNEEMRPVPGYDGSYSITRDGRVWSHPKAPAPGKRGRKHDGRWIHTYLSRREGKHFVTFSRDGEKRGVRVSTLINRVWGDA
jgi:hypothetical protein